MHQTTACHRQPILLAKQRRHLAERQAELFIEDDGHSDGFGPELHRRRAKAVPAMQRLKHESMALMRVE
jgi:hypothetical protein